MRAVRRHGPIGPEGPRVAPIDGRAPRAGAGGVASRILAVAALSLLLRATSTAPTVHAERAAAHIEAAAGAIDLPPAALPPQAALPAASSPSASSPATGAARCPPEPLLPRGAMPLPLKLVLVLGEAPAITGSASLGTPTRGSLWGGVELGESADIERAGGHPWGTSSAVRSIERAAREARRCHPGSPRLRVGDLGREHGGWLRPHRSHQSGLDADIGYFYRTPSVWYERATARNLDVARTWTLVRAFVEGGNVDTIFMDQSVQRLLKEHIRTLGSDAQASLDLFAGPGRRSLASTPQIRHAGGHASHFHVRFRDEDAVALGARLERARPVPPGRRR